MERGSSQNKPQQGRIIKLGKFQNGGRKGRSTMDNFIAIIAVVDRNRRLGKETMVMFVDAEKCFDKLWLEDRIGKGKNKEEATIELKKGQVKEWRITHFWELD